MRHAVARGFHKFSFGTGFRGLAGRSGPPARHSGGLGDGSILDQTSTRENTMTFNRKAVALACLAFGVAVSGSASAQGTPPPAEAKKDAPQVVPAKPSPVPDLQKPDSYLPFLYGPLDPVRMTAPSSSKGKTHIVAATPATTQWGYFDSSQAPVLRINPGDTVVMETMTGAHNQIVPGIT